MRYTLWLIAVLLCSVSAATAGEKITAEGEYLAKKLDELDVRNNWKPKRYVDWETGKEIHPKETKGHAFSSHCSAFVAAACMKFGVYILRPPEHSEVFLTNAQYDWLHKEGQKKGWEPVTGPVEAQQLANEGKLVVVTFKAKEAKEPGHIALVHPWVKTKEALLKRGPEITQAGETNYQHTSAEEGFKHHHGAWPHGVRYFVHSPGKK